MKTICAHYNKLLSGSILDPIVSHGACKRCAYKYIIKVHKKEVIRLKKELKQVYVDIETDELEGYKKYIKTKISFHEKEIIGRKKMYKSNKKCYPITILGSIIMPLTILAICALMVYLGSK